MRKLSDLEWLVEQKESKVIARMIQQFSEMLNIPLETALPTVRTLLEASKKEKRNGQKVDGRYVEKHIES